MKYGPKCPNHKEVLEGLPSPLPKKGTGVCPVSKESFDYEIDLDSDEEVVDKFGNLIKVHGFAVMGKERNI